jgi:ArsR family transcriptional regulator
MKKSIDEMSAILKLAADKTRLTILCYIKEKELCVCDLVELIGLSQPAISQHLRKMLALGLVRERRKGTWAYYSLNAEAHPYILQILDYVPSQAEELARYEAAQEGTRCEIKEK